VFIDLHHRPVCVVYVLKFPGWAGPAQRAKRMTALHGNAHASRATPVSQVQGNADSAQQEHRNIRQEIRRAALALRARIKSLMSAKCKSRMLGLG